MNEPSADAARLFPAPLDAVYDSLRTRMLALGDDVTESFTKTQVGWGAARKFLWLTPLTKTKALLTIDLYDERSADFVREVIAFRPDKHTHQIEVRTPADIDRVADGRWLEDSVAWGRKEHP